MITDDAILVNMALDGKREAFDELVRKHRSRVLSVARMLVGSADIAEDVAQQAFVAAFANLRLLRDPASFRPWLMTITRRCASRQWTEQSRETTGLHEAVVAFPCYQPVDDAEVRARIAEMLAELSARDRKVVVMHYLDGCTCREIGESLGIPPGTVKRILHESRSCLRASSELMRGAGEMSQKNQGPRNMEWWISGDWPGDVMDTVLRQSICLTINKSGLTPQQIAKRVDANEVYVREALDALQAEELIENVGRGRYRNTFVALGAEDYGELIRDARRKAERMADLIEEALPELRSAWESSPKPSQGFDWDAGIWPLLAVPVRFYGIKRNGSAGTWSFPAPPVHPASGKSYWGKGIERIAPEHMLCFISLMPLKSPSSGFHFGHFWSYQLPFATYRGAPFMPFASEPAQNLLRLLGAVASGLTNADSIAKAAQLDIDKARATAANLIEMGLLDRAQDGFALTFPVFASGDDDAMLSAVDRVCKRLAGETDSLARLADAKLNEIGFGFLDEQLGICRQHFLTVAEGESLRVLYDRGILPHPGDPAPASSSMMGWFDTSRLFAGDQ